jgi:ubiquinone/menaquinone biosynthesis C-methylase UbiE
MHNWASGYGGTLANPAEDISRRVNEILDLSKTFEIRSILDFGSGSGEMISALSEHFEVDGLEPEERARLSCHKQNMRVHASTEELRSKEKRFDLVTLFHVVEHFYKPDTELAGIYELLKPGGLLLIETPNSQDALLTKYNSLPFANFTYWTHHPMLHSNKSLESLVTRSQFNLISNSGAQRYGLENHLFWLTNDKPGGHIEWKGLFSEATNLEYKTDLTSLGLADTIWLLAQKPLS